MTIGELISQLAYVGLENDCITYSFNFIRERNIISQLKLKIKIKITPTDQKRECYAYRFRTKPAD